LKNKPFYLGLRGGIPVALGYLSASFSIGMMAASQGLTPAAAAILSASNVTSAGEVSTILVMGSLGTLYEIVISQLIINLRYSLMSLSLSQVLEPNVGTAKRALMAFGVTDEIFALGVMQRPLAWIYYIGLMTLPLLSWTLGTWMGALLGALVPAWICSVLCMGLYGMFIAIIVPPSRANRHLLYAVLFAVALSCLFAYLPALKGISVSLAIIISGVIAALAAAWLFPRNTGGGEA